MTHEERSGIDQMSLALGGRLGGIEKSLEIVLKTLSEDRISSATYRTDIRGEFSKLKDQVQDTQDQIHDSKADIRSATETLTELRPKVHTLEQAAAIHQGIGRFKEAVWRAIYGLFGGAVAVAIGKILFHK